MPKRAEVLGFLIGLLASTVLAGGKGGASLFIRGGLTGTAFTIYLLFPDMVLNRNAYHDNMCVTFDNLMSTIGYGSNFGLYATLNRANKIKQRR
ncbi:hypothetical protein BIW11_03484 [Tropilaelaps mercedesae]|uniref:Uncharacterized protein n=1 Tax=Tropilaelaps mercedesae TaxID=418985 RepID=A0A1V9XKS2_9ACAR|nr:hypothetical protein BIW11_03484 [Tropilaelaps mercedesae]